MKQMPGLTVADLVIGDVVLVECTFVREKLHESHASKWATWTTEFHLEALSRLIAHPRPNV